MRFKNIVISKFQLLHFVITLFSEIIFCLIITGGYGIFSLIFFGEGANSFMYSATNTLIYQGLIILPPVFLNFYKFFVCSKKGEFSKSKNYFLIQWILVIAFTWFVIHERLGKF